MNCAWIVVFAAMQSAAVPASQPTTTVRHDFDDADAEPAYVASAYGEQVREGAGPKLMDGKLYLLESWWKLSTAVGFPAPLAESAQTVELSWTLIMNTGTEGAGFAWLDVEKYGTEGAAPELKAWEAPSADRVFGVGFDASNPPNRDPFRGSGNVYDRPQHEVSLHWDGMEIVKRTTPMEFRDEEPHAVKLRIEFVVGGADVTVSIDETAIFERYFIPSMTAYTGRPAFGGHNTEIAGDVLIDDLVVACGEPVAKPPAPREIIAIDHVLNDKDHGTNEATVEFPENTDEFGRIICTLRLDQPETRFDPWDRLAHVYVYGDDDERFELLRYITPYHRGHVWQVDVTDFRPLLRGERKIEQACGTQGEGWVVTVKFDFYPGPTDRRAYRVINLWNGNPEVGNPDKPVTDFYTPQTVLLDERTAFAQVRTVVTGHGMSPNTNNAAEFMPLGRTLTVNGESWRNTLWKTDNYLNPCRPQGGTWKYDRAGWAPGDVVRPWAVDVSHLIDGARELKIGYELDGYINEARGKTWAPSHATAAQVILYERP